MCSQVLQYDKIREWTCEKSGCLTLKVLIHVKLSASWVMASLSLGCKVSPTHPKSFISPRQSDWLTEKTAQSLWLVVSLALATVPVCVQVLTCHVSFHLNRRCCRYSSSWHIPAVSCYTTGPAFINSPQHLIKLLLTGIRNVWAVTSGPWCVFACCLWMSAGNEWTRRGASL